MNENNQFSDQCVVMFYVLVYVYAGSDDSRRDENTIEISAECPVNAMSEKCTEGFCGFVSDCAKFAHGAFENIDDARAVITRMFGEVRDRDENGEKFSSFDRDVYEVYKPVDLSVLRSVN